MRLRVKKQRAKTYKCQREDHHFHSHRELPPEHPQSTIRMKGQIVSRYRRHWGPPSNKTPFLLIVEITPPAFPDASNQRKNSQLLQAKRASQPGDTSAYHRALLVLLIACDPALRTRFRNRRATDGWRM